MTVLLAGLCIVSCKDDDDKDQPVNAAKAVEGVYSGEVPELASLGFKDALSVKLESVTDSTVSVSVENELPVIGRIATFNATVKTTEIENKYSVNGAGSFDFTVGEVVVPMPVQVSGNAVVVGTVKTLSLLITVGLADVPPFPLAINFSGTTAK